MDKTPLRAAILDKLNAELETLTRAALMARDEAIHEESKPENQYDMHAQEAAYLAEGQAKLVAELRETIALYQTLPLPDWAAGQPVGIGAVITLEAKGRALTYFLGPRSGGLDVDVGGQTITIVTPASPVGRQLLGARVGAGIPLPARGGPQVFQIVRVE